MRTIRFLILLALVAHNRNLAAQDKVVRLYDGPAPGSEAWAHTEQQRGAAPGVGGLVYNVVHPTLSIFPADPATRNGTAVIICPGGAFFMLAMEHEGFAVARALSAKGVTCFVLKYRLVESKSDDPMREMMSRGDLDSIVAPVVPLAMADGLAAMEHVRRNAKDYGVDPRRIGIMGFSAGGTVAASVAHNYTPDSRPDFAAPIYVAYSWVVKPRGVPADAPPMFLLAATDDPHVPASQSVDLYRDWTAAKKPAELHMYAKGGHGFGMNKQQLPTDHWIDRFTDWLDMQGLMKK